ncbi:MAG: hypothetical protein SCH70_07195 [Candidatus Methanoperedens sp.]|nr:hypothetical protein [Candidatus Methanoperedens sp.]
MADYKREPALRLFAAEIAMTTEELERPLNVPFAPAYAVSPTGAKINRVLHIGTLVEIEDGDNDFVRGRIVDPTGAVHIRAGQYQPEIAAAMRQLADKLPMFIAVTGKLNIYKPDENQVYVSIRPESLAQVTEKEREMWLAETTKQTLARIKTLVTSPDELPPEIKYIIDGCYHPALSDLKDIVRAAAGLNRAASPDSTPDSAGKEKANKPEQAPATQEETAQKKTGKAPEKVPATDTAGTTDITGNITEDAIAAASKLLTDLCNSSENGTAGANQFLDRIKEEKIASAEKSHAVLKAIFDRGLAYEPMIGRLRVVV